MKRFIALFLALLLPFGALAETTQVTLEVQAEEALFSALLKSGAQNGAGIDAAALEAYVSLLKTLLKDTSITMVSQENASSVSIILNGTSLMDAANYLSGSEMQTTSSLIPGYVLVEADAADSAIDAEKEQQIAKDLEKVFTAWKEGLVSETTYGVFAGDAYSGGTQCTTWTITDSDIAALMSAVMTPELRGMIEQHIASEDGDQEDVLAAFDAANARVAEENKYAYILRRVEDDQEKLVGFSLSVFEAEKQLATLSIGPNEDGMRIVLGLGLKAQNYWSECKLTKSQRDQTTFIKGEVREWTADKSESFAYVAQTNAPAVSYLLNCIATSSGQRKLWDGHVYLGSKTDAAREILAFSGSVNQQNKAVEASFSLMENKQALMTISISKKPVAAILPPDASLIRCAADDPDQAELYTKVSQEFAFAITMRLMQIIPFDVLMTLDGLMP